MPTQGDTLIGLLTNDAMEWNVDWTEFYTMAVFRFSLALLFFGLMAIAGVAWMIKSIVVEYIVRMLSDTKELLAILTLCLGISVLAQGVMQTITTFIFSLLDLQRGDSFLGASPSRQIAAYAVGTSFIVIGSCLIWAWHWWKTPRGSRTGFTHEELLARRARVSRWGNQWLAGTLATYFVLVLLPLLAVMPAWLAKKPGEVTWTELILAAAAGTLWGFADALWRGRKDI
jgi:hypothetical protein